MIALSKKYYVLADPKTINSHESEKTLNIDNTLIKTLIYEDRVKTWFLEIAELVNNHYKMCQHV